MEGRIEGHGFDQGKRCAVLARVVDPSRHEYGAVELFKGRTLWDVERNGISWGLPWMAYMSGCGMEGVGGRSSNSLSNARRG